MHIAIRETDNRTDAAPLPVRRFTADRDPVRYARFHHIRTSVFAGELGWQLSSPEGPWLDPFDRGSHLFIAEAADGAPVGIVRALVADTAFPHRERFARDLERTGLTGRDCVIGTLNALAVLPAHRGRLFRSASDTMVGTAAHLLLRSALKDLASSGVHVVFATVLGARSARSFLRVGFRLLDVPQGMPGQERFTVANVGVVLPLRLHRPPDWVARTRVYLAMRHRQVAAMGSVDELFAR
jgi:hypothetical protein